MDIKRSQVTGHRSQGLLKGKRILITAGPTWVPIDSVRVISNIATGKTGILLAEKLNQLGARVTLILGPVGDCSLHKKIKILRFRFFEELREAVKKELRRRRYDYIIHSAAVSDFKVRRSIKGKFASDRAHTLRLSALPKIIDDIRRAAPCARMVMFKLECAVADSHLIREARRALELRNADIAVANRLTPQYKAYILDKDKTYARVNSKEELVRKLIRVINGNISS